MIWEWLIAPVDPLRVHDVGVTMSWHARLMVLAWGVIAPLAVLMARFFKVLPGQDWPRELDNKIWWRSHWISGALIAGLSALALVLILLSPQNGGQAITHRLLGYVLLMMAFGQLVSGVFRGSKGGPTAPGADGSLRGDHYDMTAHRLIFEAYHKTCGYVALALAASALVTGLWTANAPHWMWLSLAVWWGGLASAALWLQLKGHAVDTYQAIWGPDTVHPGNRIDKQGWGTVRSEPTERDIHQNQEI